MHSIRRWFYRPKKEDSSCLAQFYWADEELNLVAAELDSFDGRKDPERCSALVNQLRICQDKVLTICGSIMDEAIPNLRANRDFQAKFPDDILQENLAGQLWFGAECLAAGSNILNRELESASMRPLAKALTRALDNVRFLLREQCLRNPMEYSDKVKEALWIFDRLFADFEFCYVSAMVPVKSVEEYHLQQEVVVLFSETLHRALKNGLVPQEMVDDCDPSLMFTIPRLAIVCGLLIYPEGPLRVDANPANMSELFRPFFNLLLKIRELLWTLTEEELQLLEKTLCSLEDPEVVLSNARDKAPCSSISSPHVCPCPSNDSSTTMWPTHTTSLCAQSTYNCKQFIKDFYAHNFGCHQTSEQQQNHCNNNFNINSAGTVVPTNEAKTDGASSERTLAHQNNNHLLSAVFHRLGHCELPDADGEIQQSSERPEFVWTSRDEISQSLPVESDSFLPSIQSWEEVANFSAATAPPPPASTRRRHSLVSSSSQLHQSSRKPPSQAIHIPRVQILRQSEPAAPGNGSVSSCSSCRSHSSLASSDWDLRSYQSTETSSYHSECQDDEEIALALQAAEIAACNRARAKFRDSTDLIHRLFVCISGVADQLQTNFASDLRNILKCVFEINSSSQPVTSDFPKERISVESLRSCVPDFVQNHDREMGLEEDLGDLSSSVVSHEEEFVEDDCDREGHSVDEAREALDLSEENNESLPNNNGYEDPPAWLPDGLSPDCMACNALFTLIRRRHHCRNCGKIFCARCSSNSIPLPRYGHLKPVRVCNPCFIFQVTQLLVDNS